jgi:hypothetical protein
MVNNIRVWLASSLVTIAAARLIFELPANRPPTAGSGRNAGKLHLNI